MLLICCKNVFIFSLLFLTLLRFPLLPLPSPHVHTNCTDLRRSHLNSFCRATTCPGSISPSFHHHFTCSFYTSRSQKHKKDSQVKQLFVLSGSAGVKAARKHIDEIDPQCDTLSLSLAHTHTQTQTNARQPAGH